MSIFYDLFWTFFKGNKTLDKAEVPFPFFPRDNHYHEFSVYTFSSLFIFLHIFNIVLCAFKFFVLSSTHCCSFSCTLIIPYNVLKISPWYRNTSFFPFDHCIIFYHVTMSHFIHPLLFDSYLGCFQFLESLYSKPIL